VTVPVAVIEFMVFAVVVWGWWPVSAPLGFQPGPRTAHPRSAHPHMAHRRPSGRRPEGRRFGDQAAAGARPHQRPAVVAAMVISVVAVGLLAAPRATVGIGLASAVWFGVRARSRRIQAQSQAVAALPEALELCNVVLGAGGTLFDCLRALGLHGPEPVRSAARESIDIARHGARLDAALQLLRERLGLGFQPLTGALLLAWQQGGSVGLMLNRLTTEANQGRRRLGDLRARRLPVLLLGPLILFALPAVIIGAIVPIIIVALRDVDF